MLQMHRHKTVRKASSHKPARKGLKMKKTRLYILALAFLWLFAAPQQAQAQYCSYGIAYGASWTWQDNNAVYGYSATALDYCAGLYYDPAVYGRFSEGNFATENVRLLADAYTEGYADWIPAEILFGYGAPRNFEYYNTDSIHYVLEYYQYYACFSYCGNYWYDPWGWGFAEGGGPNYYGYGGAGYWSVRRRRLGSTYHTIIFQPPNQCQPGQSFAPNGDSCPNPTPTPTPTPTPSQTVSVRYETERENNGIPMANGSAVGSLPNRNSTPITAIGSPSGGTYTWSKTSDKVSLSSTSGSTITVTANKPSDAVGDVVITLVYELPDGRRAPVQQIPMTVQKPSGMKYVSTTLNQATAPHRRTRRGRLVSGWKKIIVWQIVDQLGNPITFRLPVGDTINNNTNDCLVGRQGEGTPLSKGFGSDGMGLWPHTYELYSPVCLNGGSCSGVTGFQRYTVNGFVLSNDDKSYRYQCNGIQVEGDGSTLAPSAPARRRATAAFTDQFYITAFNDWASDDELQSWTSRLNTAAGQGQSQLLSEARVLARAVFNTPEYMNITRSDEDFVTDLYNGYLGRAPDQGGFDNWLTAYRNDLAQGINGHEHLLQGFEYSTEFANLVASLEIEPPPSYCDPMEEQLCYNNGGLWDSGNCSCEYFEPPPDPCYSQGYYCY
jgi:hypothetical protein